MTLFLHCPKLLEYYWNCAAAFLKLMLLPGTYLSDLTCQRCTGRRWSWEHTANIGTPVTTQQNLATCSQY